MGGINRYDSPAQDRYFNTYVPLPFEQMMPVVAARQSQLQREQDMLNKTYEDTQNIKYIPGTKDEAYVRDYLSKTGELVNKYYGQDLSDPIVKQQMLSQFRGMTNKQNLQNIESSYAGWTQNQKLKAQLKAEGMYDPAIDEDPANADWDTIGGGKAYDYITSPYKNPRPAAETYFNNIKPSDLGPQGDYFFSGVTENKINEVASAKWGEFANTSEGSLYVKKIARERGLDYTNPDVKRQIATEYLKGVGKEFIYSQREGATLDAQVRAARDKKDTSANRYTTQRQPIIPRKTDPLGIGNINYDDEGNLKYSDSVARPTEYGGAYGTLNVSESVSLETKKAEAKAKVNLIRERIPQLKGLSDSETYKAYKEISADAGAMEELPLINIGTKAKQGLAFDIASTLNLKSVYVEDGFGSTDLTNAQDNSDNSTLKEIGWTSIQFKNELEKYASGKESALSTGGLAPGARKPGMVQFQILDKSKKNRGKMRTLFIDSNDQFQELFSPSQQLYSAMRNFESVEVPVGFGAHPNDPTKSIQYWAKTIPDIRKDSDGKWKYNSKLMEGVMDENGEFVEIQEGDMSSILDTQMRLLDVSNYTGSDVEFTSTGNPFD